jgi:molybdopterin/thiamine biosynthesis adenylyltransferase/molybdopterin synthase catalytic subunit/rhodanese-related sulfurtransferase
MSAFTFTRLPIVAAALDAPLASAAAGGFASFEGRVREHNEGRRVDGLEYEAFEALALAEGCRIVAEATARHGALGARCVHRLGRLAVGDVAVWVGVAAVHRDAAFAACRDIIDAVKHRLPIWKKEHYVGGDSGWVNCERCAEAPEAASGRFDYSRQAVLPGVGADGQSRLAEAAVLVVGAGGLGCAALAALAGAGVGRITIVDPDRVEASNLHRQPLYARADIGRPKAAAAARRLAAYNGDIEIVPLGTKLERENALALVAASDVTVECTDSFAAKFLVNDAAIEAGRPAVIASVYQYEGQLQVVRPDRRGSCLRCQWPEATRDGLVGTCREAGVLGPVPAVLGNLQAIEALKLLLDLPGQLRDEILLVDFLEHGERRVRAPRDPRCAGACVRARTEAEREAPADIDLSMPLAAAAAAGYRIVDIREPEECALAPLPLADRESLPLGRLLEGALNLHAGERYLLVCAHGVRSHAAAEWLRSRGSGNVWSLRGGIAAQD